MTAAIQSIGTALPEGSVTQAEAVLIARSMTGPDGDTSDRHLARIYANPAVQRRASVVIESRAGETACQRFYPPTGVTARGPTTAERLARFAAETPALAERACREALGDVAPRHIGHLITVSCTGFAAPGLDSLLLSRLGLSPTTPRTNIGYMGCHGAINALRVADALVRADPEQQVLVCAVELCSLHFQYDPDPGQAVANALFADGAAAALVRAGNGANSLRAFGSCLFPDSGADMTWTVGDHGFQMGLTPRVPELIRTHLRPWLSEWLGVHGLTPAAVGAWAIHPGGPRILDATAESLSLPPEAMAPSREVLAQHGNMSSPTILFILDRLRRAGAPGPTVLLGFGPGMIAEAALLA